MESNGCMSSLNSRDVQWCLLLPLAVRSPSTGHSSINQHFCITC